MSATVIPLAPHRLARLKRKLWQLPYVWCVGFVLFWTGVNFISTLLCCLAVDAAEYFEQKVAGR